MEGYSLNHALWVISWRFATNCIYFIFKQFSWSYACSTFLLWSNRVFSISWKKYTKMWNAESKAKANAFSLLNMKRSNSQSIQSDGSRKEGNARLLISNPAVIPASPLTTTHPPFFSLSVWQSVSPEPQLKLQNHSVWQLLNKMDPH